MSDTNDDTTAGAVTSKYLTAVVFETGVMPTQTNFKIQPFVVERVRFNHT